MQMAFLPTHTRGFEGCWKSDIMNFQTVKSWTAWRGFGFVILWFVTETFVFG
jgi:hypothetical protein